MEEILWRDVMISLFTVPAQYLWMKPCELPPKELPLQRTESRWSQQPSFIANKFLGENRQPVWRKNFGSVWICSIYVAQTIERCRRLPSVIRSLNIKTGEVVSCKRFYGLKTIIPSKADFLCHRNAPRTSFFCKTNAQT